MSDCDFCKRTDVKCCATCGRDSDRCDILHECGKDCPSYIFRTNYDRIRAMGVSEMASFLDRIACMVYASGGTLDIVGWLNSPADGSGK